MCYHEPGRSDLSRVEVHDPSDGSHGLRRVLASISDEAKEGDQHHRPSGRQRRCGYRRARKVETESFTAAHRFAEHKLDVV